MVIRQGSKPIARSALVPPALSSRAAGSAQFRFPTSLVISLSEITPDIFALP